jgi:hypothetical protein
MEKARTQNLGSSLSGNNSLESPNSALQRVHFNVIAKDHLPAVLMRNSALIFPLVKLAPDWLRRGSRCRVILLAAAQH